MRARTGSPKLKAPQFINTLSVIERFHFQHTIVSQLRSSGGVSEMYAKAARDLYSVGSNPDDRARVLSEIRGKLTERRPERERFLLAFEERFFFTNSFTRESKLVRYVLESFLRRASPTTSFERLSIEHIMPQKDLQRGVPLEVIGALGNLMLVSDGLNSKLGDKAYPVKRSILASDGSGYDIGGVLDVDSWTAESISARTRMLAKRAYDEVWKLPV